MEWKRQIYNTLGTSKRWTASDQCVESCHCQLLLTMVCCGLHGNIYCNNNNNRVSHYIVQLVNLKVWAHFHLMYNVLLVLLLLLLLLLQQLHADAKVWQQVFQASSGLPPVSRSLWLSYPILPASASRHSQSHATLAASTIHKAVCHTTILCLMNSFFSAFVWILYWSGNE